MGVSKRKNALTDDGFFWSSTENPITITSDSTGYTVSTIDIAPVLTLKDPKSGIDYDVLHELKSTRAKLAAMETLVDILLERATLDTTVAEALDKHNMIRKLSDK